MVTFDDRNNLLLLIIRSTGSGSIEKDCHVAIAPRNDSIQAIQFSESLFPATAMDLILSFNYLNLKDRLVHTAEIGSITYI